MLRRIQPGLPQRFLDEGFVGQGFKRRAGFGNEDEQGVEKRPYGSAVLSLEMDVLPIARDEEEKKKENYHSGLLAAFMDTTSVNNREGIPAVRRKEDIDSLRDSQTKAVLQASQAGDGIFFGRCSSYILRERPDALRIFTCASLDSCRARISCSVIYFPPAWRRARRTA